MMPIETVLAVLCAAMVHASWNAMAKGRAGSDPLAASTSIALGAAVTALPVLAYTGLPATASFPYVVWSGFIHAAYFALIGLAYRIADFSVVYPLTRGSSPMLTAGVAWGFLGESMPPLAIAGILLLCSGVLGLGADALRRGIDGRSLLLTAVNAGVISVYTAVDGAGTRLSGNAAAYVTLMMLLTGLVLLPVTWALKGRDFTGSLRATWRVGAIGGCLATLSYGVSLWAMTRAPIGIVAALRESSVLFAAVIGALFLGERFGIRRWLCGGIIFAGIVIVRLA